MLSFLLKFSIFSLWLILVQFYVSFQVQFRFQSNFGSSPVSVQFQFRFKSSFGLSPVLVAFLKNNVGEQPLCNYNCTAIEKELIVYHGIWFILSTKFSYGLTLPWLHIHQHIYRHHFDFFGQRDKERAFCKIVFLSVYWSLKRL